jgi:hypothetical protein
MIHKVLLIGISTHLFWRSGKDYQISARAVDNLNIVGSSITYIILIDTHPPVSTIQRPAEGRGYSTVDPLTTISGVSEDYMPYVGFKYSGIQQGGVKVVIRLDEPPYDPLAASSLDQWWKWWGSSGSWVSAADYTEDDVWFDADIYGQTDNVFLWRIIDKVPNWVSGKIYRMRVKATDRVGNVETVISTRTFTVDIQPPVSRSVRPADGGFYNDSTNKLTVLSGTAIDDLPDNVKYTKIRIWYESGGVNYYWGHTGWVTYSSWVYTQNLTPGGTWWVYTTEIPWISGKVYYMNTQATDNADNTEVYFSTISFRVDVQPALAVIKKPQHNAGYNATTNVLNIFEGRCSDDFAGVKKVEVALQRLSDGYWWQGGVAWGTSQPSDWPDANLSADATYWWLNISTEMWTSGVRYNLIARGIDNADNVQTTFDVGVSSVVFYIDYVAPNSYIVVPVNDRCLLFKQTITHNIRYCFRRF